MQRHMVKEVHYLEEELEEGRNKLKDMADNAPSIRCITLFNLYIRELKRKKSSSTQNPSMGKLMRKAGYSQSSSTMPKSVTGSKQWQVLCTKYLKDSKLLRRHEEMLDKKEIIVKIDKRGQVFKYNTGQPHSDVNKALDIAYRIKNKYLDEGIEKQTIILTDDQIKLIRERRGGYREDGERDTDRLLHSNGQKVPA